MAAERVAPDTLITQTNLSGSITDIDDDPDSPDGNWLTADDDEIDTDARVGFATPASAPLVGKGLQEFKVQVRKTSTATGNRHPTLTVYLYDNGTVIRNLGSETVQSTGSQVFSFFWDGIEAASQPDGSVIEVVLHGTVSSGSAAQKRTVEIGAVEWNADTGVNEGFTD